MKIPSTTNRVPAHTSHANNERIQKQIERNIAYYAKHPEEIDARLEELDREWDIERTLEANAATLSVTGVALGVLVDRKWFLLPAVVGSFLLQHAIQGWCPPLPVFRRAGVRTQSEIDCERYALKVLRGDFNQVVIENDQTPSKNNILQFSRRIFDAVK
jgi:hypothetical protein